MSEAGPLATVDVAIVGGGMSGLALACQIDQRNNLAIRRMTRAVVLEPRESYQRDKTWCYWRSNAGLFDPAITHSWSRWEVRSEGRAWTSSCPETPYVRVDSSRYYELAAARLARSNSVGLKLGVSAEDIRSDRQQVCIDTDHGQVRAARVIDTRPRPIPQGTLLQHFYGWEIETDKDVFDPSTVTLMDFRAGGENDVHFFYVLPFSARSALVETTHFSHHAFDVARYQQELGDYLRERFDLSDWRICHRERGVLPMAKRRVASAGEQTPNVLSLGLHADTVKPSTGYCYPQAQHQALQFAEWLSAPADGTPPPRARSRVTGWFDSVFLSFLEHQTALAPAVFFRLFQQVQPVALVRFLSDSAKFSDYLRVIWAMPKAVMMREAIRYVFQR